MNPQFRKFERVFGKSLIFRNARVSDACFILDLRLDPILGKNLSATSTKLEAQIEWLDSYSEDPSQVYYIIMNRDEESLGTVRLYDQKDDSFCWGSWILKSGVSSLCSIESALMVYEIALLLGFNRSHFDVRKQNYSVWRFHEKFGAVRTHETHEDFFYTISNEAILRSLEKYRKYLPDGISISDERHYRNLVDTAV